MRRACCTLLLLTAGLATAFTDRADNENVSYESNQQIERLLNVTDIQDGDVSDDGIVRKKRTFGDLVFRGLADVLGYDVQRKPPQTVFPPPVAPLPQFDVQVTPCNQVGCNQAVSIQTQPCGQSLTIQAGPCTQAVSVQAPPCGTQNQAATCNQVQAQAQPCNVQAQQRVNNCGRAQQQAAPVNPCSAQAAANPCNRPQSDQPRNPNDLVTSNLQFSLTFNRNTPAPAAAPAPAPEADVELTPAPPRRGAVPYNPAPARLPPATPSPRRKPRVFVDAFVVRRNGDKQSLPVADAKEFNPQYDDQEGDDYEDPKPPSLYDYYEDAQESRATHTRDPKDFARIRDPDRKSNNVKYVRRGPASQSLSDQPVRNRITVEDKRIYNPAEKIHADGDNTYTSRSEEDREHTTSTEDPNKVLVPRVLPATENNPNNIDTITVRVPPIYRSKNPRKLHKSDEEEGHRSEGVRVRRRKKKKVTRERQRREANKKRKPNQSDYDPYSGYDFYHSKESIVEDITIPTPTKDPDLARLEAEPPAWSEVDDQSESYRLPEYIPDDESDSQEADEGERSDQLSPNAQVYEKGYRNNFSKVTAVKIDDPNHGIRKLAGVHKVLVPNIVNGKKVSLRRGYE